MKQENKKMKTPILDFVKTYAESEANATKLFDSKRTLF